MVGVDAKDVLEMAAVKDQEPVEALRVDGANESFSIAFAFGARTGVFTIRIPSLRKTSSNGPLYLPSRSRIKKRTPPSLKSKTEVAGLLSHPLARGTLCAAGKPRHGGSHAR
jgi:hypothetical protein